MGPNCIKNGIELNGACFTAMLVYWSVDPLNKSFFVSNFWTFPITGVGIDVPFWGICFTSPSNIGWILYPLFSWVMSNWDICRSHNRVGSFFDQLAGISLAFVTQQCTGAGEKGACHGARRTVPVCFSVGFMWEKLGTFFIFPYIGNNHPN